MDHPFAIQPNNVEDRLEIWQVDVGEWRARLVCEGLCAEGKVRERHSGAILHLNSYFEELARRWRGWEGVVQFEALGLGLAAAHDRLGHVSLHVRLQRNYAAPVGWEVHAPLVLDAGGFDRLVPGALHLDAR